MRLWAKLTGCRIDIKSEEEKRKEVELQSEGFEASVGAWGAGGAGVLGLPDIHDEVVAVLQGAGYQSAAQVVAGGPEALVACGLDEETVQAVLDSARAVVEAEAAEAPSAPEPEAGS